MIEVKFKDRLKELRKINHLFQRELAEKINVSVYIVSDWEKGRSEPCLQDLINLAVALNTTIDYLVGKDEIEKD
ncbi:MAG: helix-turn-helix transcriptional regulator [Clostridia bacterium]|nr:helix-turn-helix transcriptional regulator [Clostridia bacterium]